MKLALRAGWDKTERPCGRSARPPASGPTTPDAQVEADELAAVMTMAIDALPPKTKAVFLMSRVGGLAHKEIAETLGVSVKTVETLMDLGR